MQGAEEYLRLEAYRTVRIREGEEVIELTAIQAVFRAMGVSALKGNRFVQKTLAELVAKMERDHHVLAWKPSAAPSSTSTNRTKKSSVAARPVCRSRRLCHIPTTLFSM